MSVRGPQSREESKWLRCAQSEGRIKGLSKTCRLGVPKIRKWVKINFDVFASKSSSELVEYKHVRQTQKSTPSTKYDNNLQSCWCHDTQTTISPNLKGGGGFASQGGAQLVDQIVWGLTSGLSIS